MPCFLGTGIGKSSSESSSGGLCCTFPSSVACSMIAERKPYGQVEMQKEGQRVCFISASKIKQQAPVCAYELSEWTNQMIQGQVG
jgi:hypothetical protein